MKKVTFQLRSIKSLQVISKQQIKQVKGGTELMNEAGEDVMSWG
ncbi:MAG: hypothetical protein AAGG75_05895 [Bacteroidota bacterium]